MNTSLSGRRAVVCGSTRGIGRACAQELAVMGASVTLLARDRKALEATAQSLSADDGQKHSFRVADFFDPESVKSVVTEFTAGGGFAHILVNNTGGPLGGPIIGASRDEFERAFQSHVICSHYLVQALLPAMKRGGYGRIINIVSTSVRQPIPGLGVSNTTRGAIASWAKTLAGEVARFGVTVNNVLPGATKTERLFSLIQERARRTGRSVDEEKGTWLTPIPAGRFAEPSEIAAAVAFLASPAASYITGVSLPVDGGRIDSI